MGKKLSAYNLHMKRELKGKMKGKTKAQRKAIFKAAARKWKGKPKSVSRSKPKSGGSSRSSSTTRRSNTTMGKKRGFGTQKLFKALRMISLVAPAGIVLMGSGTPAQKAQVVLSKYTGIWSDGSFHFETLREGYEPFFWTSLATYGIPKLVSFVKGMLG